ncbi:mannitol dehydrogenase family protein [Microbacterium resistens]|uniref:Mannitol dehydrogenase family protein n=1 Tax=Microbacterium resistens TaxID=156977 RepID=A0ABY3RQF4_9MICO|nr:mannitol dehydrogenase family protein [Microbacterium resistens]UGS25465.1 mannitol dehydrogenase family protein [Microbacterium resistens]
MTGAGERPGVGASLSRTRPAAPVRVAHLGLGAFHRAHQAWYTQRANDAARDEGWGIASFTGRSSAAADRLRLTGGVYTLLGRSAEGDRAERIESIVRAVPGADDRAWQDTVADPNVGVLTVTVTEAGYGPASGPPARIAAALLARADRGADPIAVVSCDNLLGNGRVLRQAVRAAAAAHADRVDEAATFVDTVVDRITPAVTNADLAVVRELTGHDDPSAVVTEPFAEWVLAGDFPSGRPAWEAAGARIVADAAPYEERKLWLLNAGHSVLAAAGRLRGYETVAEAFEDPELRDGVEALWDEQREVIDLPAREVDDWLTALRIRFTNPRIAHRLDQIRRDSTVKIPLRVLAPLRRRREAGLPPGDAQLAALDAWVRSVVELPPTDDATSALASELAAVEPADRVRTVVDRLSPGL